MKAPRILLVALVLAFAAPVIAQTWPSRPVTIVAGYPAGSGVDMLARFLAENLRQRTGQPFIVENRPGGFGIVAAQSVTRSAPDGYTILFVPVSIAVNVHLFKKLDFDPIRDFTPITTIASAGFVLLVNPSVVPVKSVAELTEYIKTRPGKLAYGSGTALGRVAAELYLSLAGLNGLKVMSVPYKGTPPALNDLMAGRIHFLFVDSTVGTSQARAGKVKALAVTNPQRISAAPDIPTMAESGVPGYDLVGWYAVFLPANAPGDIAQKLAKLCNASMTTEKASEFLRKTASDPYPGSPESLAKFLDSEIAKWGRLIKAAGIEPE